MYALLPAGHFFYLKRIIMKKFYIAVFYCLAFWAISIAQQNGIHILQGEEIGTDAISAVFRSKTDGNWSAIATWEIKNGDGVFVDATRIPVLSDDTIFIKHKVTLNTAMAIDQIVVEESGHLNIVDCGDRASYALKLDKVLTQPELLVLGKLTINESYIIGNKGQIMVKGSMEVNYSHVLVDSVIFNGSQLQQLSGQNPSDEFDYFRIERLVMDNPNGLNVSGGQDVNIIIFRKGIIYGGDHLNIWGAPASLNTAHNGSYVEEIVRVKHKEMHNDWFFPLGKNGVYRPVWITSRGTSHPLLCDGEGIKIQMKDGAPPLNTLPAGIQNISSIRHYTISRFACRWALEYQVKFSYGPDDAVSDPENLTILRNNIDTRSVATGEPSGTIGNGLWFKEFSNFVLANKTGGGNLLPVTWLSFDVKPVNADAQLEWKISLGQNCDFFEVSRSRDGINFKVIGVINRSNNLSTQSYRYIDANPGKGTFYYQLRQVDIDGKFGFSPVRKVSFGQDVEIRVYPNPAKNVIQVVNLASNSVIRLYHTGGGVVLECRNTLPFMSIQVGHLPSGIYELLIIDPSGEMKMQKIQIIK
jgi:hypothetical protein